MAEIVNLARARKQRRRQQAANAAAEIRARFGRSRAQKELDRQADVQRQVLLDGARLKPPEDAEGHS
jgi:hypothetical protein